MSNIPLKTVKFPGLPDTYTIPSKVSDLNNDTGFITSSALQANQVAWTGSSSYGTSVQSAVEYVINSVIGAMRSTY